MDDDDFTSTGASTVSRARNWFRALRHLNFYRIHLLVLCACVRATSALSKTNVSRSTFTPLFFSGIFYAANGRFHISYVDSLFACVTSMTVTGLSTIDLSQLTAAQQAILYVQTLAGSLVRPFFHMLAHDLLRTPTGWSVVGHGVHSPASLAPISRSRHF